MTSILSTRKRDLIDIYKHAIKAIRPENLIENSVTIRDGFLTVVNQLGPTKIDLEGRNIHVVGGGKSVLGMAAGLAKLLTESGLTRMTSHNYLSVPIDLKDTYLSNTRLVDNLKTIDMNLLFGARNNVPDDDSVKATTTILEQISRACHHDRLENRRPLFIVLLSGGGSACLTSPKYINLDAKLDLIKFLVQRGADIIELNKVRRYFSNIKGGKLVSHILTNHQDSQVLSLVLSDVIGDPIEFIASGPTCLQQGTDTRQNNHRESMLTILRQYGYNGADLLPDDDSAELLSVARHERVINRVIGNNSVALEATRHKAQSLGYRVEYLGNDLHGHSEDILSKILKVGNQLAIDDREANSLVICGGEATVEKLSGESWGVGGRVQEMALDYVIHRLRNPNELPANTADIFLAGSTDGQDGPTDVAACISSYYEWLEDSKKSRTFSLEEALEAKRTHDSNTFWSKHKNDCLIRTGLTGTNVMDLYMYLVCRVNEENQ